MPSPEPENKMDAALKAYAKQRREQADPALAMHPATRRLLQDEVRRTFGAGPPTDQPRARAFLMRWIWGSMGSALAVLLLLFAVLREPLPESSPGLYSAEKKLDEPKSEMAAAPLDKSVQPPEPPEGGSATRGANKDLRMGRAARLMAADAPSSTAATAQASDNIADAAVEDFVQVTDAKSGKTESLPANVLSNFRLSRAGQSVQVVDADGSVYNGQVLAGAAVSDTMDYAKKNQDLNSEANYSFQVAGTNHHLRQSIVFTGNAQDMPVAAPTNQFGAQNRNGAQSQKVAAQKLGQGAQNSRITGKVQVADGKEFKIEAKQQP